MEIITCSETFVLQRQYAIQVLREIIRICANNGTIVSSVSLVAPSQNNGIIGYQLKIGTALDSYCRASLMPLLNEKSLEIEETKGYIVIFKKSITMNYKVPI